MNLCQNIKQFRGDNFIKQEYVAERLCMSQANYSRLEKNNIACAKRLSQIANALGTTSEVLRNYHLANEPTIGLVEIMEMQLQEKETLIENLREEIRFLDNYSAYMQMIWAEFVRGENQELKV